MWVSKSKMESLEYRLKASDRSMRDYREQADEVYKAYDTLKESLLILYPEFVVPRLGVGRVLDVGAINRKAQAVRRARQAKADALVLKEVEGE